MYEGLLGLVEVSGVFRDSYGDLWGNFIGNISMVFVFWVEFFVLWLDLLLAK